MVPSLEVSLSLDKAPSLGHNIAVSVTVTNRSGSRMILEEHVDAQLKEYNGSPQQSFWRTRKEVRVQPGQGRKWLSFAEMSSSWLEINRQGCIFGLNYHPVLDYLK